MLVTCIPLKKMAVITSDTHTVLIDTSNCKYLKMDFQFISGEEAHEAYVDYVLHEDWWVEDLRSFTDMWTFGEV